MTGNEKGLLSGIRVLEAASMIMVPSVGAALADYGAEVIKLEPIEGDLNRRGHHIPRAVDRAAVPGDIAHRTADRGHGIPECAGEADAGVGGVA